MAPDLGSAVGGGRRCDTPTLASRRSSFLRGIGIALAGLATVGLPAGALAAGQSKVVTVLAPSTLHMTGSDLYCTALKEASGPVVACFHDPGGPSSSVRKGYAIAAGDAGVAVEPTGSTTPVESVLQPSSLSKVTGIGGGRVSKAIIELGLGDVAGVGGTHMAILVTAAKGGGNAIGVVYLDGKGNPIVGTYTIGISNQYVTIVQITGVQKSKTTYRHAVY